MERAETFDLLLKHRAVALLGKIDSKSAERLVCSLLGLQNESNEPIMLLIGSAGGSTHAALAVCDFISHVMTAPVHGIAWGECSSAATFILLHCAKRSALPHTYFVIHSGRYHLPESGIPQDTNAERNLVDLLQDIQNTTRLVTSLYRNKLKMTEEEVQHLMKRGDQLFNSRMTAEEALRIGLIQEIVQENVGIFK